MRSSLPQNFAMAKRAMRSAEEADGDHAGAPGRPDPVHAVLDHDAACGRERRRLGRVEEEVRRGLSALDLRRAEDVRLERLAEPRDLEGERDALGRRARGDAARMPRGPEPVDQVAYPFDGLELAAEEREQLVRAARL